MNAITNAADTAKYIRSIEASKRVRWEIDRDVIKGRRFDTARKYLPDGLSLVRDLGLPEAEARLVSQIQGRTYANVFGLVERFITAKLLEVGREHSLGNQHALEALVRFSDEEIKHQELFRRIEAMIGETLPAGYRFDADPDAVARAVLAHSTWAVLVLTLHIELFVQLHYRESIDPDADLSDLFKDVFLFHWKDECQHAMLDELELKRHDAMISAEERDRGVDDFIRLVQAVDGILQDQAAVDTAYFAATCGRPVGEAEAALIAAHFLKAYRWQYILSGAGHPRFQSILKAMVTEPQMKRISDAVASLT
ncbi:MAG: hypothetical protein ACM3II_01455 [Rhodospirillaceae bacterium]